MAPTPNWDAGLRYVKVATALRDKILRGVYKPGEKLPPQRDLAKANDVSFGTFKVALDLLEQEGYLVRKQGEGTYAALPQRHVPIALVVDDDPNFRTFLAAALQESGWESIAAESGLIALEKLKDRAFDLVFLDLVMRGMNGAETFREIRKVTPGVEVVIVTGYPDSAIMSDALRVGPFAVISKPFSLDQLHLVLRHINVISGNATTSSGASASRIPR